MSSQLFAMPEADAIIVTDSWRLPITQRTGSIWRRDMSTQKICCLSMQAANGGVRPDVPARKGGKGLGIA